jgi:hypothetical protein
MNGKHNLVATSMAPILFQTTDWDELDAATQAGETGICERKTIQLGSVRIRRVRYSENYRADHWCKAGHLLFVLNGEIETELSDGRTFILTAGMSYQVTNDDSQHRSFSRNGAELLIIDGEFLNSKKELLSKIRM